ncbi:MAG: PIN domain-containing protein [Methanocellales archaeon]
MRVILDTNALMIPAQFKVDIFANLESLGYNEVMVPSSVLAELERIKTKGRGKAKVHASIAIELAKKCQILESKGEFDREIASLAKQYSAAVFTNDAQLRKNLRSKNVKTLFLRGKSKIESD